MTQRLAVALVVLSLSVGAGLAQGGSDAIHSRENAQDMAALAPHTQEAGALAWPLAAMEARTSPAATPAGDRKAEVRRSVSHRPSSMVSELQSRFLAGYDAHGGNPAWRARFVATFWGPTEACPFGESTGNPLAVSEAGHLGLGSFHPDTWHRVWELAGLPVQDWRSPFWQGAATAIWSNEVGPEPPGGWSCW